MLGGRRVAVEAVRAGLAREVVVAAGSRTTETLRDLLEEAGLADVPVRREDRSSLDRLVGDDAHQGVAVRVRVPRPMNEHDLGRAAWTDDALAVVLDGITDPANVGAIARSAEGAGASVLVLRIPRGGGVTPGAVRASAGALLHLRVAEVVNVSRALERLGSAGFWIVGLDAAASTPISGSQPPPGRLALVIGSEDRGLSRLVRETCDELVSIPLRGRVGSLNASAAAAVALFAYADRPSRR